MTCTLTDIRQYVARELGMFVSGTPSNTSTTTSLVDLNWPVYSSQQDDLYSNSFILRPSAGAADAVRQVASYVSDAGALQPDAPWGAAPTSSESYELHGVIEPKTAMNLCINEGLKRCMVTQELLIPTIAQAQRHSISAVYPWVTDPAWIRQVGWLAPNETQDQVDPYMRSMYGQAQQYESVIYLEHRGYSFTGGETLYVRVCLRAYDQINRNWTASATLTITGSPTGGAFQLDYAGATTSNLNYNCTAAQIQTALQGLPTLGSVTVAGTNPAFVVTFTGVNNPSGLSVFINGLTGGSYPGVTIEQTMPISQQSGMVNETDICPVDVEYAGWAAIVEAWRRYSQILETGAKDRLLPNRAEAAQMFTALANQYFQIPELRFYPLLLGGPPHRMGWGWPGGWY